MKIQIEKSFVITTAVVLVITGVAKVWSAFGAAHLLESTDPIFGLSFQQLMVLAGMMELVVAAICFFGKNVNLSLVLAAWLCTSLLAAILILTAEVRTERGAEERRRVGGKPSAIRQLFVTQL